MPTTTRTQERDAPAPSPDPADIFIVDDEEIITQLIADALSDMNYSTHIFHDGASALLEIIRHPPRLVLLDIGLPVMSGAEVLVLLRARGIEPLPIIIMSAGVALDPYLSDGATAVLPKPFDIDALLDLITLHISA
jgi:two-component system, OmpR family, KDP operon response regulator KdpE